MPFDRTRAPSAASLTTRVADLLVADDLAAYADNPRHKRAKLLTLTSAGEGALAAMAEAHRRWVAGTAPDLAALHLPRLTHRLDAVRRAVDGAHRPGDHPAERS